MIKTFVSIIVGGLLFLGTVVSAHAQSTELIRDYAVDIIVHQDSSIRVREDIAYDFGASEHHGIFRDIPYKYKARGGTFTLRFTDIGVTDEKDQPYQFVTSTEGDSMRIKIGDPNTMVTGLHVYRIAYTVQRAINYFADHDELYWNAIGTNWAIPIEKSAVTVHMPVGSTNAQCYVGEEGSTANSCSILDNKKDTIAYTYAKPLQPNEGFTIVAGMPAGTITKPTAMQKIWDIVRDNGILLLPLVVLGIMVFLWRRFGKDAKGMGTIIAQYDPPVGLSPLYMGALVDNTVHDKDLSAEIIYLAEKGYLTITRIETKKLLWFKGSDYTFNKIKDVDAHLSSQSAALLRALFSTQAQVSLSDFKLNKTFGKKLIKVRSTVFDELTAQGYYRFNPKTAQVLCIAAASLLAIVGGFILGSLIGYLGVISAILSGLIIAGFAFIMPALTKKGVEAREYILGLKQYVSVAEADRLAFHNAPEKNPERFELLLPFAIALGVERLWAKQFEGIYNVAPSWYHDGSSGSFNSLLLVSSMNDFSGSMQSAMASSVTTASSGGSGFSGGGSGGGGGGGGGGSW